MAKLTKENFIASLKEMNLLEIKELIDGMKEEFGVDPKRRKFYSICSNY